MSTILVNLRRVHDCVHVFTMKLNYSEPKIYTGGVDISKWSSLSKVAQKAALKKEWYVYFSFRNPQTEKLERQNNIKAGANSLKNKRDRLRYLKTLQRNLLLLLEAGFNPYEDNTALEQQFFSTTPTTKTTTVAVSTKIVEDTNPSDTTSETTLEEAFELVLRTKEKTYKTTSFTSFKSHIGKFRRWVDKQQLTHIDQINKKTIILYLNEVLDSTSARTRNNTRTDLSSFFQTLEDNDIIKDNFVRKINVLKSTPKRHKTYNNTLLEKLNTYLEENDPNLMLFVKFISYNFLRPIEVCRLKIKDIDVQEKKLHVKAKNSPVKIKIIPEILLNDLPDLSKMDPEYYLFTPNGIGGEWNIIDRDKRSYYSNQFKKVKHHFKLGNDYGLYSFRHTFITKLYNEFSKTMTPFEAKSKLMLITGHKTMDALEKYLRDIDAVLPEDYSSFLES